MSDSRPTLYVNGRVRTLRDDGKAAGGAAVDALVTRDGRIVASGDEGAMRSLAGRDAEVVNLRGATLLIRG